MQPTGEAGRIRELRQRLLQRLLRIIAVAGIVAYGPSAYLSIREGVWIILAVDTLACLSAVCLALLPAFPFRLKVAYLVTLTYVLGVLLLAYTGPFGAGHLFLFAFVFLAALFGDVRTMVTANAVAVLTHLGFFLASAAGLLAWPQGSGSIIVISVNAVLISLILSVSANYLLRGYAAAAAEEERLRETVEMMLRELEHRVKNNLQVISSLVSLRARSTEDPRRALEDIRESISSLGLVHQLLYRRNAFNLLEVRMLLSSLVDRFRNLFRGLVFEFEWNGPELEIDGDLAVSLGLLINEIVMNSAKHAFGPEGAGTISLRIQFAEETRAMILSIGDDGRGMEPEATEGIGLQIIRALAGQLDADIEMTVSPSVQYQFRMKFGTPVTEVH
jgi:two-component sensor histidine kinase